MKKKLAALAAVLALSLAAVNLVESKTHQLAHHAPPQFLPVVLDSTVVRRGPVQLTLPVLVEVRAVRDAVVSSRISAYLRELPRFEGERFAVGDLLAALDPSQARAELLKAEATLAQSRLQRETLAAELAAAESNVKAEQARVERLHALYRQQGASLEQTQAAEANLATLRARLAAAGAAVRSYDALQQANAAAAEAARENLAYTDITAAFDGVVSQRLAQPGDLVTLGKPLLKVIDPAAGTRLLVSVPESVRPVGLRVGGRLLPLRPWPEATAQGLRRFEARDSGGEALAGERITAELVVLDAAAGLLLPHEALLDDDGLTGTVLVVAGEPAPTAGQTGAGAHHGASVPHHRDASTQHKAHDAPAHGEGAAAAMHHGAGAAGHPTLARAADIEALTVTPVARGAEGVVVHEPRLAGRTVLIGSPDLLSRVRAGTPFRLRAAQE